MCLLYINWCVLLILFALFSARQIIFGIHVKLACMYVCRWSSSTRRKCSQILCMSSTSSTPKRGYDLLYTLSLFTLTHIHTYVCLSTYHFLQVSAEKAALKKEFEFQMGLAQEESEKLVAGLENAIQNMTKEKVGSTYRPHYRTLSVDHISQNIFKCM